MRLDIEALAREAGMNVSLWNYGAGSIVFTMGTEGLARGALERFASLVAEQCAKRCEAEDVAPTDDPIGVQECIAAAIRQLLEDK
jgi:hypothetical protein